MATLGNDHEALFLQMVLHLADKYNVTADIDFEAHNVNFRGECDEKALAIEIAELFSEFEC